MALYCCPNCGKRFLAGQFRFCTGCGTPVPENLRGPEFAAPPAPVQPEPVQPAVSRPEPVQPAVSRPEPVQPVVSRPEPVSPVVSRPEPVQPAVSRPEPVRPVVSQPVYSRPAIIIPHIPEDKVNKVWCRYCGERMPDRSIFCFHCGGRQW